MVENEAFDDVIEGPVAQLGRERSTALEIERARARQLARAADPIRPVSSSGKRVGPEPDVQQNAEFVALAGNAIERIDRQPPEARSEEPGVGQESVQTGRSPGAPQHRKK